MSKLVPGLPDHYRAKLHGLTYEAAAVHAGWDRAALEDDPDRWKAYQTRA